MSSAGPKHAIYENLAAVAQALGHPHRLELLEHLAQGVRSVEELSARTHLTFANTSRHLQILRREGPSHPVPRMLPAHANSDSANVPFPGKESVTILSYNVLA